MQTELPVKAYACYQGEGGGDPIWFDDPSTIVKLFNALATTNVTEDVGEIWTDDYTSFGFEFADGTKTGFMFDSMTIQVAAGNSWKFYALEVGPDLQSFADMAKKATLGE